MDEEEPELPDDHFEQIGQLRMIFQEPMPDNDLKKPVNFIIRCGKSEWRVHEEMITRHSGFFKMMTESQFKEAKERVVNLPEDEPELVARMIMYCYFWEYPLSPNRQLYFGVASVVEVLKANLIDDTKEFSPPLEPRYDAVLHLKMYILADKFDMCYLLKESRRQMIAALKYESSGFQACIAMVQDLPEHLKEDMEDRLADLVEYEYMWSTKCTLKAIEKLSPDFVAKLSGKAKENRFGKYGYINPQDGTTI